MFRLGGSTMKIHEIPEFHSRRELITLPSTTLVSEAAKVIAPQEIGAVPVVDGGKLVGIFSERDIMRRVVAAGKDPATTRISEVMTPNPQTASPNDWISTGMDYMVKGHYRHLPIVDDKGELVGFLSQRDFLAMNIHELLKQTARVSFITLAKAPPVWILIGGMILYTILILYV